MDAELVLDVQEFVVELIEYGRRRGVGESNMYEVMRSILSSASEIIRVDEEIIGLRIVRLEDDRPSVESMLMIEDSQEGKTSYIPLAIWPVGHSEMQAELKASNLILRRRMNTAFGSMLARQQAFRAQM
jgi:hypothetical protein